ASGRGGSDAAGSGRPGVSALDRRARGIARSAAEAARTRRGVRLPRAERGPRRAGAAVQHIPRCVALRADVGRGARMSRHAVIVGNGLAGALLAVLLGRAGWRVSLYERRGDPRAKGYQGGRSINLALSARGLAGLAAGGLDAVVRERDLIP